MHEPTVALRPDTRGAFPPLSHTIKKVLLGLQEYTILTLKTLRSLFHRRFYWRDTVEQMDLIGVGSIWIVLLIGLFTGMVLALEGSIQAGDWSSTKMLGRLLAGSVVRELGPVITSLVVAGRVGSSIAAQIGAMKVTEQLDALCVIGTDPIRKLIAPRFVAAITMLPVLVIFADIMAILGALVVATITFDMAPHAYLRAVGHTLGESGFLFGFIPNDLLVGLLKPVFFGGIIAMTAAYFGLRTNGGADGIRASTTRAVVTAAVLILAVDYLLTRLFMALLLG